jgi:hypothetical protein
MLAELDALPERQRKRFFEGKYQTEVDGALWTFETIEHARCLAEDVPADLRRVVVAVDPSGTAGDEDTRSDNIGIIVAGMSMDNVGYVLADRTCNLPYRLRLCIHRDVGRLIGRADDQGGTSNPPQLAGLLQQNVGRSL